MVWSAPPDPWAFHQPSSGVGYRLQPFPGGGHCHAVDIVDGFLEGRDRIKC